MEGVKQTAVTDVLGAMTRLPDAIGNHNPLIMRRNTINNGDWKQGQECLMKQTIKIDSSQYMVEVKKMLQFAHSGFPAFCPTWTRENQ